HIMFGEIGAWLYKAPGGIKPDENQPGFKKVILQPYFVEGLNSFEATHDGPYGKIISSWKRTPKGMEYKVIIPANSSATVKLAMVRGLTITVNGKEMPSGTFDLQAGEYLIELK
ncbi:MAG: alpha-rhamnosidase, partial [Flavobacterium sp.]